jgi:hypothetical protein
MTIITPAPPQDSEPTPRAWLRLACSRYLQHVEMCPNCRVSKNACGDGVDFETDVVEAAERYVLADDMP